MQDSLNIEERLFLQRLNFYLDGLDITWSKEKKAYCLATVWHETGDTFESISELYGTIKEYSPYYGRGYVQITHEENYKRIGKYLYNRGLTPFASILQEGPNLALDSHIAMLILVLGMERGWFSGVKLSDFINEDKVDFYNARKIINRLDRADTIADKAKFYRGEI